MTVRPGGITRPLVAIGIPLYVLCAAGLWVGVISAKALANEPPAKVDFARQVRPILSRYCFQCHGPDDKARQAELRLDTRDSALAELPSGARAIVPGNLELSALCERVSSDDKSLVMPPAEMDKRPTPAEIALLRQWVEQGAEFSRHWAYVKPVRRDPPPVSSPQWCRNEIDRFTLATMEQAGLTPTDQAEKLALLRRVSLDLTGLPPTLDEAQQFVSDTSPTAYDAAVDRLLAKPTYGERWAAVWLDLARYGDSQGYIHDPSRTIWRWRDWLITALNRNLPYDQFTIEMLAGDLLPGATTSQIIATGFHRNTTNNTEGGSIAEEYRHASVVDRVNTTMQVWLGSTFACAQCHSHKYDPFSQKEYYQLFAIFNGTLDNNSEDPTIAVAQVDRDAEFAEWTSKVEAVRQRLTEATARADADFATWEKSVDRTSVPKEIADILQLEADKRGKEQIDKLLAHHRTVHPEWTPCNMELTAAQTELDKVATTTLVMKEAAPRQTFVAVRGEYKNRGDEATPGTPAALHPAPAGMKLDRLGLARWIVDPENPLSARVAVNRLWQEIFGIGLVETSEEFGSQGELPSHPELLDWLATEYVRLNWDTKALLKLLVTSATYRQSSQATPELLERDPLNRLLARGPRVRLPAEALRDQALAISGLLSAKMYGPPVHPPQPVNGLAAAFGQSTDWETSQGEDRYRRALYTRWRRNLPYASMITFDAPERSVCSMRRIRTNTPLQALVTLNDPVFVEAAQSLGRRILREGGNSDSERASYGLRLALTRTPTEAEVARIVTLQAAARQSLSGDAAKATALATKPIGPLPTGLGPVEAASWTVVGNVLLNLDELLAKR